MTNEEVKAHMDMLIAHKDKAIETHPYFKGMSDNFEAQPTSDDDIIKALKAVRTIHNGNYAPQIDEAIRRLNAQPTDKCKGCYYNDGEAHAECVICENSQVRRIRNDE